MVEIKYPIRDALKKQGITQDELARKFGRTRQTVSRYLSDYERTGTIGNEHAQQEFDRMMASEMQRIKGQDRDYKLELIRARREVLSSDQKTNTEDFRKLLMDILENHPDVTMYDYEERPVTKDSLNLETMWVNDIDNEELMSVLTDEEKERWERIQIATGKNFHEQFRNGRMEEALVLEKLWDCTDPQGKPVINEDRFSCTITEEEAGTELYEFECESFCMVHGSTTRIYAEDLYIPAREHDVTVDVLAIIEVITDKGLFFIDSVKMEEQNFPSRFMGQVEGLIPGYKYIYSLAITADDYDELNKLEYTLLEGYHAIESHPLK